MISKTQFSRYVKDALAGFYDPAHLETHPLSRCLIPNPSPQETRGLALREVLAETIEMLRQIILNLIPEAAAMAKTEALTLLVEPRGGHVEWVLHGLDAEEAAGCDVAETDGLVVSQGLLDVYGGRLWLECEGEEATLRFTLPTARPWTILIVDDKPEAAQLYQRYLQDLDCVLWAASDAQEVAQRLADGLPDLVLLDVLMPNEDGWSVLQRLRTDPTTADVPVVICSMLSQPRLGLALGATAVLQKPISQEDLLQTVAQLLHREDSPATVHPTAPPSP